LSARFAQRQQPLFGFIVTVLGSPRL